MWAFFALLYLLVMLVQTTLFGRVRLLSVKLNLMPIVITCVGLWAGHEAGGLFGLLTGLVWSWTGAKDGSLAIVSFTLIGIFSGWLCDAVFPAVCCLRLCFLWQRCCSMNWPCSS